MDENKKHLEDLVHIRGMMERSSRFLSLSGLSGVFAGIYALAGAAVVYFDMDTGYAKYVQSLNGADESYKKIYFLLGIGAIVLIASLLTGFFFTYNKAKKQKLKIWDGTAKRMMSNLFVPLVAGGVFGIFLITDHHVGLVAPITLLFYGLGLYSASKYSFVELRYLGLCEIVLGLVACWNIGFGLLFWSIGFGLLHIVYGAWMYFKYERGGVN